MDLEQLKSFCTVAQYKSFRKAADVLQITQPAVSRRIKSLENELGITLLKRSPQSIHLTKAGSSFLPYAERMIQIMEEGTKKALENNDQHNISIAASSSTSFHLLPKVIHHFTKKNPRAHITIYTLPTPRVVDMLLDQTIDIGFTTSLIPNPLITATKVFEEDVIFVGHPHLVNEYIDQGRIIKTPLPIIDNNISTPPWSIITAYISRNQKMFKTVIKSDYPRFMCRLVEEGVGMAFLPLSATLNSIKSGTLVSIDLRLDDFKLPKRPVYLLTYKDAENAGCQEFKETAIQFLANYTPQL